jgi:hypothetical protein
MEGMYGLGPLRVDALRVDALLVDALRVDALRVDERTHLVEASRLRAREVHVASNQRQDCVFVCVVFLFFLTLN